MEEGGNASHFNTALLKHSIPLPDGPAESLEKHMTNPETFCGVRMKQLSELMRCAPAS